jgi:hypothetical protein
MLSMQEFWIEALGSRRPEISRRWKALLFLESADGPLAHPENLVHLIDWTLDEVLADLRRRQASRRGEAHPPEISKVRAGCHCGHNPLFNLFVAGEQALLEALIELQASNPSTDPLHRSTSVAELYVAIRAIAMREFELLCSLCVRRPQSRRIAPPAAIALPV